MAIYNDKDAKKHPKEIFKKLTSRRQRLQNTESECNNVIFFLEHVFKTSVFCSVFYRVIWLETFSSLSVLVSDNLHRYQL